MMQQENWWRNPFGDGRAGESILDIYAFIDKTKYKELLKL